MKLIIPAPNVVPPAMANQPIISITILIAFIKFLKVTSDEIPRQ